MSYLFSLKIYCVIIKTPQETKNVLPTLKKLPKENVKHVYKLENSKKERHLAIDEGVAMESKRNRISLQDAAKAKKARLNVLRIYRRFKKEASAKYVAIDTTNFISQHQRKNSLYQSEQVYESPHILNVV